MATRTLVFLNYPAKLVFSRSLNNSRHLLRKCQYSTSKVLNKEEKPPKRYSTSPAAKVTIEENIGLKEESVESRLSRIIIVGSVAVFLLYFCVFREENDMDDILKGNSKTEELELIDLKLKLAYCEKNNLPTQKLRARIEEIVEKNRKPVFRV